MPGDPDQVEQTGRHYRRVAVVIDESASKLRRIVASLDMDSIAVDAFRSNAVQVAGDITRVYERYDGTGQALIGYAPALRDAQAESLAALRQAQDAEADLAAANRMAEAAHARATMRTVAGLDATAEQGAYRRAVAAADEARAALAAARRRLDRAVQARDRAAQRAMGQIQAVEDAGNLNDALAWLGNWRFKLISETAEHADEVAMAVAVLATPGGRAQVMRAVIAGGDGEVSLSDVGHFIMDLAGMLPGAGIPIDVLNAGWYELEGKHVAAGTSLAGAVPLWGWGATGGKFVRRAARSWDEIAAGLRTTPGITLERSKEIAQAAREKGLRIKNSHLAGQRHPETGVPFRESGFPDFSAYADAAAEKFGKPTTVEVKGINGDYKHDFKLANKEAGFEKTPEGYTWHHVEDCRTMQLVPKGVHRATGHTGCVQLLKNGVVDPGK